jgi:hypothetical protein
MVAHSGEAALAPHPRGSIVEDDAAKYRVAVRKNSLWAQCAVLPDRAKPDAAGLSAAD